MPIASATLTMRGGSSKMRTISILLTLALILLLSPFAYAQQVGEARDSLVRLVEAQSATIEEADGVSYRKIIGSARFLHNNTYLLCDTALWNVNENVIKAVGNVQIIQDNTFLTSDRVDYVVDENLAKFRGTLVELYDKEGNVLRTNYLDYNTRDSIATFFNGGVMKGSGGNIIEGLEGWYFAYDKLFSFEENVEMFTDSVFIKTSKLEYNTVENKAYFDRNTIAWQEDNMLFTNNGEFDRGNNIFRFKRNSYILTKDQELWADTISYYRNSGEADLYKNIQILDTKQSAYSFADEAKYRPNPVDITLTKNPAVALYTEDNGVRDTLFLAADTLKFYHVRRCDIDSSEIAQAKSRVELSNLDPMIEIEAASAKNRVDNREVSNFITPKKPKIDDVVKEDDVLLPVKDSLAPQNDSLITVTDSLGVQMDTFGLATDSVGVQIDSAGVQMDSLGVQADSVAVGTDSTGVMADSVAVQQLDTTAVTFIDAWHNVKVYRNDLQALCDSLVYTELDSMARLYINPVVWNNVKHQLSSDSMQLVIKNNVLTKANLLSNAFIASQEDTVHYNQIKGTEMVAYFRDNDLFRFDALGGASMIFYLQEDSIITIMNHKEGKIISARIKNREIQRIKYIESLRNDAHPVFNLSIEEQRLKGFNWRGDERPVSRFELVDRSIKKSQRETFKRRRFPTYPYAAVYFPDERDAIMEYKHKSDSIRIAKYLDNKQENIGSDSLTADIASDSMPVKPFRDSLDAVTDTIPDAETVLEKEIETEGDKVLTKKEERAIRKAEKIKRREERKALKRKKRELRKQERLKKRQDRLEAKKIKQE